MRTSCTALSADVDPSQACLGGIACVLRESSVDALWFHDAADLTIYTAYMTNYSAYMTEHLGYIMLHPASCIPLPKCNACPINHELRPDLTFWVTLYS